MKRLNLNHGWSMKEAPLSYGKEMAGYISNQLDGWYNEINLPCDVHMPLIEAGVIKDPVLSDYCFDAEWIEKRSWWFKKSIDSSELDLSCDVAELVLESLDVNADVFFNGAYLGHHSSAFYPFRKDVKEYICPGKNELIIRLTSGLETVSDSDLAEIDYAVCAEYSVGRAERGDKRRAFIRKPTYVYGWDWCPRIGTCAIAKNAYIDCISTAVIRNVSVETIEAANNAKLSLTAEVELLDIIKTADADIKVKISKDGKISKEFTQNDVLLCSGLNYVKFDIRIEDAELWWPNGMGDQPLYLIEVSVNCRGNIYNWPAFKYGIRTISLDTERIDHKNRRFMLVVNGKHIYCKGGDWIPADSIYARVTPEKYDSLILEAKNANFNMLRIWGGGIYERDEFYDACDKYGIMIWHDMMFGCSTFPDHIESFRDLVGRELDYQTKRLGSRTCLAIFCGNNENHWIFNSDGVCGKVNLKHEKQYGMYVSNNMMPDYVRENCSWVPYWNSSPYGGDEPNADNVGDVHHWHACMTNPDVALRIEPKEYDKVRARFVSEYGYPGPCSKKSIEEYFDGKTIDRSSGVWNLHNNTFEKETVNAGIKKHYTDREIDLDEYLLYAGMTQSLMLGYSLESLRFKDFCGGGLFWMYNDCWGEVGWTIIDYYLRRKISFYGVKRAFEPLKLIIREIDGNLIVMGCNDKDNDISFNLRVGWVAFDGSNDDSDVLEVTIPARARKVLHKLDALRHDIFNGIYYARPEDGCINPAIFHATDTRKLKLCPPRVNIMSTKDDGSDLLVNIKADTFCHGVYLDIDADWKLSDNYFDMLPGENRSVRVYGAAGKNFSLKTLLIN
jgi:beta-mannosidase